MYSYFSVILLLSIASIAIGDADSAHKCNLVTPRLKKCCNSDFIKKPCPSDLVECQQLAKPFPSCDLDTCLAKKLGGLNDDGTVDKQKLFESYKTKYGVDPFSNEAIHTNCINGDISKYGMDDFCELLKLRICFETQLAETCPEWSNEGECEGAEEFIKTCLKSFE